MRPWLVRAGLVVAGAVAGLGLLTTPAHADGGLDGLADTVTGAVRTTTSEASRTTARTVEAVPAQAQKVAARPTRTVTAPVQRTVRRVVEAPARLASRPPTPARSTPATPAPKPRAPQSRPTRAPVTKAHVAKAPVAKAHVAKAPVTRATPVRTVRAAKPADVTRTVTTKAVAPVVRRAVEPVRPVADLVARVTRTPVVDGAVEALPLAPVVSTVDQLTADLSATVDRLPVVPEVLGTVDDVVRPVLDPVLTPVTTLPPLVGPVLPPALGPVRPPVLTPGVPRPGVTTPLVPAVGRAPSSDQAAAARDADPAPVTVARTAAAPAFRPNTPVARTALLGSAVPVLAAAADTVTRTLVADDASQRGAVVGLSLVTGGLAAGAATAAATGTATGLGGGVSLLALLDGGLAALAGAAARRTLRTGRLRAWSLPRLPGFAPD
ncbi:hypothetical protein [Friedmanniella luteola]|uniref:hypothetical protein n=1 Tax=Friedmanniella luteola TaxID=546871 RepID=UPI000B805D60|nr:hypothetical protein [Friedmanniella luteola]